MKQNVGFTLIEVLLALAILAGSVFFLSDMQIKSMFRVFKSRDEIDRVFLIKKDLYSAYFKLPKDGKPVVNKVENPKTKIVTELVEIGKKSEFKDFADKLQVIQAEGQWVSVEEKYSKKMISFIFKPKEKEKKK